MMAISFFATLAFATLQGTYTLFLIKQYARPEIQTFIRTRPQQAAALARREQDAASRSRSSALAIGAHSEEGAPALAIGGENTPYPPSMGGDFSLQQAPPEGLSWRQIEKLLVRPRAAQLAAWIFASIGIVSLLVQGGLIGPLKKRFGEVPLILAGTLLMAIGLALVPFPQSIYGAFPVMALLAFGNSMATPILTALVSELSPEHERGEMIGVFQSIGSLGRIFGPNVGGTLFGLFGAGAPYFVGGAIMMVSFVFALSLRRAISHLPTTPEAETVATS